MRHFETMTQTNIKDHLVENICLPHHQTRYPNLSCSLGASGGKKQKYGKLVCKCTNVGIFSKCFLVTFK